MHDVLHNSNKKIASLTKQDRNLSNDALVWSTVFIDWLDSFELFHRFMNWLDWPCIIDWLTDDWIQYIISVELCPISCISWVQIWWDITPESTYLMVTDFIRYYTKIKISHGCIFHEILHQNQNISCLKISWAITPQSKYLMVADFMR